MEFKITASAGGKELLFRNAPGEDYKCVQLGNVDLPSDPSELFEFMTGKLKEHGLVPADTVFRLNQ